jgi:hypothetical protein
MTTRGLLILSITSVLAAGCAATPAEVDDDRPAAQQSEGGSDSVFAAAAETTTAAGTAAFELTGVTTFGPVQTPTDGQGVTDLTTGDTAMTATTTTPGGATIDLHIRTIAGELYQQGVPGYPAEQWIHVTGLPPAAQQQPGLTDPTAVLEQLADLGGTAEEIGTDQIAGADVTRYRAVLDGEQLADAIDGQIAGLGLDPASAEAQFLRDADFEAITEVAIDGDGLIRQTRSTTTITLAEPVPGTDITEIVNEFTMTLTDFGVPGDDLTVPDGALDVSFLELQQIQAQALTEQAAGQ